MKHVAIIGAGASGLMAAVQLAQQKIKVSLFDANETVGKKITASGNGRCNISNQNLSPDDYRTLSPDFIKPTLQRYDYKTIRETFKKMGMLFYEKADGKAYPYAQESKAVSELFRSHLEAFDVALFLETPIDKIEARDNLFFLQSQGKGYDGFDYLIMATGSSAAPQLGGNSSGLALLEKLGHTIIEPYPVLVQFESSAVPSLLNGVRMPAKVNLFIDGNQTEQTHGDLLFTKYGLSGLSILDLSFYASEALQRGQEVTLSLNLLPEFDRQRLTQTLLSLFAVLPKQDLLRSFSTIVPSKLAKSLLDFAALPMDIKNSAVDRKTVQKLANRLLDWRVKIDATHGARHAEACGGGVWCEEVDNTRYESKKKRGLFLTGEVLDIVGRRGGYNFHFAWSSALMAVEAILNDRD